MRMIQISLVLASAQGSGFRQALLPILIGTAIVVGILVVYLYLTHSHHRSPKRRRWLSRCFYSVFLASVLVLSITSFGSVLRLGVMQHYALIAHLTAAGAFVFLLLPVASIYLPRILRGQSSWWLETCSAWVLVLSSMATAASMLIGMLPTFDTDSLLQLTQVHRYAGLITAIAAVVHLLALGIRRFGIR